MRKAIEYATTYAWAVLFVILGLWSDEDEKLY